MATVTETAEISTRERSDSPEIELRRAPVRPRSLNIDSGSGAIQKTASGRISRPPTRYGFTEPAELQFEELEDVRQGALHTNLNTSKNLLSNRMYEEDRLRRGDLSPEFPASDLLTWDLEPVLNSTENFDDSHARGETTNISNYEKPLGRPFENSTVGSEYVSENPDLPSRGDKFSENSLGSMSGEDSRATSPGGGGTGYFSRGTGDRALTSPSGGENFTSSQPVLSNKNVKSALKIPFQKRPAGSTRNPRVHFAEELEVAQEWTPPLDGEAVVFSNTSQQNAYYYEGGSEGSNIDTPPNLYLNKPSDEHFRSTSNPSSPATRRDDGSRPSSTASGSTYQHKTALAEPQGVRPKQMDANLNSHSRWFSSMSSRGNFPSGGDAHRTYSSLGGGDGYSNPTSGRGYGPPSDGNGYGPPSGSGQGPPAGGGRGPPSGGAGGRPPPGGPGGFGGPPGGPGGFGGPSGGPGGFGGPPGGPGGFGGPPGGPGGFNGPPGGGHPWRASNPRRYIPGYNPTSSGVNTHQQSHNMRPSALATHAAKDHVKIFKGVKLPHEVHFTPGPSVFEWLASVEVFYTTTGINDDSSKIAYLPYFTDPHSGNAQKFVGWICDDYCYDTYEEVKSFLIDSFAKDNTTDFIELSRMFIGNHAPIMSPRDVMYHLVVVRRHAKQLSEAYVNLPRYRNWSPNSKRIIYDVLVEHNFFLLLAAILPRPILEKVLFSSNHENEDTRQLSRRVNHELLRNHNAAEIERTSKQHHFHDHHFLGVDFGGASRSQRRGFTRVHHVDGSSSAVDEYQEVGCPPEDIQNTTENESASQATQEAAVLMTQTRKKGHQQNQKVEFCVLCRKSNHLHKHCRHKPARAGKDNTCIICGGNNHKAVQHYSKVIADNPGPCGPGVSCSVCQGARHDAQHCPGVKAPQDFTTASTQSDKT